MDYRNLEQKVAVDKLLDAYNDYKIANKYQRVIVKAVMRFGKSKVILDFLKSINDEELKKNIYILVPKTINIDGWNTEIKKRYSDLKVTILNYRSIHKMENPSFIIMDEIQNLTPKNYNIAQQKLEICKFIVGITGTLPRNREKQEILSKLGFNLIYDLKLEDGIDLKIVNNFEIKVINTSLDHNPNIHIKRGKFDFKTSEVKSYNYFSKRIMMNPCKKTYLARASFLYGLQSKMDSVKILLKILPDNKKILIFSKRIEIANQLSNNVIHSKGINNDEILEKFKHNDIRILSSVNMLNEGITISDIDIIIIESFDSNQNNLLQRIGRSLIYQEGKVIKVFIITADDTIERKWLGNIIPNNISVTEYNYKYGKFIRR